MSVTEVPFPSMESSENFTKRSAGLNLKATELRLGLPGSESPEREGTNGFSAPLKGLVSGAKRGFSDAIDGGSGNWVLSGNGGSEMGSGKDGVLFSPPGGAAGNSLALSAAPNCNNQLTNMASSVVKESVPQSPKPLNEKKPQISAPAAK